ncbi:hypothetical protein [Deinococcus sp.]|uniref:hypothetical protein n=1 Tax=Deinococcus sp. TaxID=47478 RepID=UPI002869C58A|nr:hypothetical protein [Deinococcus sp.]
MNGPLEVGLTDGLTAGFIQWLPALAGVLAALLWFVVSPGPSRWWGALAGLAVVPIPGVGSTLLTAYGLVRVFMDWAQVAAHLLPTALFLVCGVSVLLLSFFQREDLLRRRFAAAVMIGYLARELVYVLFFMLRLGS